LPARARSGRRNSRRSGARDSCISSTGGRKSERGCSPLAIRNLNQLGAEIVGSAARPWLEEHSPPRMAPRHGRTQWTNGATTMGIDDQHPNARCAFCLKTKDEVRPLVEAKITGVYICYECAQLCVHIVEEESKRRGVPLPEKEPFMTNEALAQLIQEKLKEMNRDSPEVN
jgi:hypothetical protein